MKTLKNLGEKTSVHVNICIPQIMCMSIIVSICTYVIYANCQTLSGVINSLGVKSNEITSHLDIYSPSDAFQIKIYWKLRLSLSNSNYFMLAKKNANAKFWICISNFQKNVFFQIFNYVVNRLPSFKNLYDHTNRFLKG